MNVYLPGRSSWLWCWSPWGGWTSPNRKLCWGKTADLFQSENLLRNIYSVHISRFVILSPLTHSALSESWLIQHLQHFNFMEYASAATQRFISYWCRAGPWVSDEDSLGEIHTYRCAKLGQRPWKTSAELLIDDAALTFERAQTLTGSFRRNEVKVQLKHVCAARGWTPPSSKEVKRFGSSRTRRTLVCGSRPWPSPTTRRWCAAGTPPWPRSPAGRRPQDAPGLQEHRQEALNRLIFNSLMPIFCF